MVSETIEAEVNGESREVFMSYGLLSHICQVFGSFENVLMSASNPEVWDALIVVMLGERKENGALKNSKQSAAEFRLSLEDSSNLLEWAVTHATNFFMKRIASLKKLEGEVKDHPMVQEAMSSASGSTD